MKRKYRGKLKKGSKRSWKKPKWEFSKLSLYWKSKASVVECLMCFFILHFWQQWKRLFKISVVLIGRDPIPLPEKARKPLTDVQEFNLHVQHRAVDRAEFDKKVFFGWTNFYIWNPWETKKVSCGLCVWYVVVLTHDWFQVKEKEMMYKRYREEAESAKQVCGVEHLVLLSCSFETIPVWRRFYTWYYFNAIWNHPCNVTLSFFCLWNNRWRKRRPWNN